MCPLFPLHTCPPFLPLSLPPPPPSCSSNQPCNLSYALLFPLQVRDWTALLYASANGHTEIVQTLLAAPGVDVNHANVCYSLMSPTRISHPQLLHVLNPPPRLTCPFFLLSYPLTNTPYVPLINPASYPTCGCFFQNADQTALMQASAYGHIAIIQALVAAPGIDVNHADVSIYPLTLLSFCSISLFSS